jgi:hypothetical protein
MRFCAFFFLVFTSFDRTGDIAAFEKRCPIQRGDFVFLKYEEASSR